MSNPYLNFVKVNSEHFKIIKRKKGSKNDKFCSKFFKSFEDLQKPFEFLKLDKLKLLKLLMINCQLFQIIQKEWKKSIDWLAWLWKWKIVWIIQDVSMWSKHLKIGWNLLKMVQMNQNSLCYSQSYKIKSTLYCS